MYLAAPRAARIPIPMSGLTRLLSGSAENRLSTSGLSPHITAIEGVDRISRTSTRRSPRPFSPEPLLFALHLVFFVSCVLPFLSFPFLSSPLISLSALSNLYRRCRTPPATGQIIHYGARACTRHVARGEARPRETGERCGESRRAAPRCFSTSERQKERERVCMCMCAYRPSLKDAHLTRLSEKE